MGFLNLLQQEAAGPLSIRQQDLLASANFSLGQVQLLLQDLLDFSRLEHNRLELQPVSFDLFLLVKNSLDQFSLMAEAAKVRLVGCFKAAAEYPVYGDPARFSQCLNNLIVNALKFSPQGGSVTVSIDCQAAEYVIKVQDEGPGISPENREAIFTRHFQTANGALHHLSGYGLGLSITKELIGRQGGLVWLESTSGQGSTFFLSLPRTIEVNQA